MQGLGGLANPLAPKRRSRGMPLPLALRLVAARLDAGFRETPQRVYPLACAIFTAGPSTRLALLRFLVDLTLAEARADPDCPPPVLQLMTRVRDVLADGSAVQSARWQGLVDEVAEALPMRRKRRSIHCHGVVAADRRLLVLRAVLAACAERASAYHLWLATAYAIADYDQDHFALRGAHIAPRVRALADWVEATLHVPVPATGNATP